jgi:two-component system, OmpR family, sensor histidine kinase CiaH
MFRKLRNRFLLINLVMISSLMIIAFSVIYYINHRAVWTGIDSELYRMSAMYRRDLINQGLIKDGNDTSQIPPFDRGSQPSEPSVSFSLLIDKDGNVLYIRSIFDLEIDIYDTAKNTALSQNKDKGNFKLGQNQWAYIINKTSGGDMLVFLDISSRMTILTNLIDTFLMASLVSLFCIYFISRFFANRSIKPVREAFDKQKQFIADASHEIRTPISVIRTNAELILSNPDNTVRDQSKWIRYIETEAENMTRLTNDLLYLTQVDSMNTKMVYMDLDISEEAENVILMMEAAAYEKKIVLDYEIEPGLTVYGSREQIREVITILCENAIKYANESGSVDVKLKKKHNTVILTVANTGDGIPEEHIGKIFDRFYRVDQSRSRRQGSYGLGLAIAKAIIEQHKGKIFVKSRSNESTTFYVELPVKM